MVETAVNLTHRLQGEANCGEAALAQAACTLLSPALPVKKARLCRVKGLKEPLTVYRVDPLLPAGERLRG
jgi:class 3 adenylate cyclase